MCDHYIIRSQLSPCNYTRQQAGEHPYERKQNDSFHCIIPPLILYLLFVVFFCGVKTKGSVSRSLCDHHKITLEQCDRDMSEFIRSGKEGNPCARSRNTESGASTPKPSPMYVRIVRSSLSTLLKPSQFFYSSHDSIEISHEKNYWNRLSYRRDINIDGARAFIRHFEIEKILNILFFAGEELPQAERPYLGSERCAQRIKLCIPRFTTSRSSMVRRRRPLKLMSPFKIFQYCGSSSRPVRRSQLQNHYCGLHKVMLETILLIWWHSS